MYTFRISYFLTSAYKDSNTRRYSVIMFRYSVITSLSLVAGEGVLFLGEKNMLFYVFFLAEIFGNIKNTLYLCNVIKELITSGKNGTRCRLSLMI